MPRKRLPRLVDAVHTDYPRIYLKQRLPLTQGQLINNATPRRIAYCSIESIELLIRIIHPATMQHLCCIGKLVLANRL